MIVCPWLNILQSCKNEVIWLDMLPLQENYQVLPEVVHEKKNPSQQEVVHERKNPSQQEVVHEKKNPSQQEVYEQKNQILDEIFHELYVHCYFVSRLMALHDPPIELCWDRAGVDAFPAEMNVSHWCIIKRDAFSFVAVEM